MNTIFDWLATPGGIELEHAVIILILAVAGYLTAKSHSVINDVSQKVDDHMEQHVMDRLASETTGSSGPDVTHNIQ